MRVITQTDGPALSMEFEPAAGDAVDGARASLASTTMRAELPEEWSLQRTHPDLLALAALLSVAPWASAGLEMDRAVSATFASAVQAALGIAVGPVDTDLEGRSRPSDATPGLAFSGGVDSTAAVAVMPQSTVLYFTERPPAENGRTSLYDKSAAVMACEALGRAGWRVRRVRCDVEYLRDPIGFPVDYSNAIPAVLMADIDGLDSIGWGTIAESAYRIGGRGYEDYAHRPVFSNWRQVFEAVALDVFNPVAGVSEVGTSQIVRTWEHGHLAQSCIRGTPGNPCGACWKCVRKSLLDSSLGGAWPSRQWVADSMSRAEPMKYLTQLPIKHECVLTYAMSKYDGTVDELKLLKMRVRADQVDVDWLDRHYGPALDLVPTRYRAGVREALEPFIGPMSPADEEEFRSWSTEVVVSDPVFARDALALTFAVRGAKTESDLRASTQQVARLRKTVESLRAADPSPAHSATSTFSDRVKGTRVWRGLRRVKTIVLAGR